MDGRKGETVMWLAVLAVIAALLAGTAIYLTACFHRLSFLAALGERRKWLSWLLAALPVAALGLLGLWSVPAAVIVLLHLAVGFLLCNLLACLAGGALHRELGANLRCVLALLLTAAYLGAGWFFAHHVFETDYTVVSAKPLERDLRIVMLADAHLGITLDGEAFAEQMTRIQALSPDAVVVVGDFVDDDSAREDMLAACRALGELETAYGVYFAYGNHDNGYYFSRDFTASELREALSENGVRILEDENVPLGESAVLIGRRDRSMRDRADIAQLAQEADHAKYLIVLDHQPNDYANESAAGVDLVLSGHTHGGHIFPAGPIGLLMGANDRFYGRETRDATTFIVTSGISGWGIPFKTGTISEFVVIDITAG